MSCSISGVYNISCDQGATFSRVITWTDSARSPYNITGYTARMHVRSNVTANTTAITLTTANSRITLGGAAGTVTLTIAATDTANLTAGLYVYDLELVSSANVVTRLIEGNFNVKAEVTR
jgi:tRNA threonylcarbamoyladenosine modification (KEOPS) complex  Pcc1 subunit